MEKTVTAYLKHLNIPVSTKYVEKLIQSHPDYPSILSAADILERFGIKYQVARTETSDIASLPLPCVIHLNKGGGELKLIRSERELDILNGEETPWSGVLLKMEPVVTVSDPENEQHVRKDRQLTLARSVLLAVIGVLTLIPVLLSGFWIPVTLLLTALVGVVTGYYLTARELGVRYQAVEAFCRAGKTASCDKILTSEDAKFVGIVTFSDMVLSYFLFQLVLITWLLPGSEGALYMGSLALLSALAIPVVLYSLYYQYGVAKTWCRLCLVVDGVLLVQASLLVYLYATGSVSVPLVSTPLLTSLVILGAFVAATVLFKDRIDQLNRSRQAEIEANRIRHSPTLFVHALHENRKVDTTPFEKEFLIGNPTAPIRLVMAFNLFCNPCKMKLQETRHLLASYPDKVSLSVRFLRSGDEGNTSRYLLDYWAHRILCLEDASGRALSLLTDWYESMKLDELMQLYPMNGATKTEDIGAIEIAHAEWMKAAEVTKTPTIFLNGYEMPVAYRMKDLQAMVPGLVEVLDGEEREYSADRKAVTA